MWLLASWVGGSNGTGAGNSFYVGSMCVPLPFVAASCFFVSFLLLSLRPSTTTTVPGAGRLRPHMLRPTGWSQGCFPPDRTLQSPLLSPRPGLGYSLGEKHDLRDS